MAAERETRVSYATILDAADSEGETILPVAVVDAGLRALAALVERIEQINPPHDFDPQESGDHVIDAVEQLFAELAAGFLNQPEAAKQENG